MTRYGREPHDPDDAWLILRVPAMANGTIFLVDFCDGDLEDEFHWLEGPYHPATTTLQSLFDCRRNISRTTRRRQGMTEFRDDPVQDHHDTNVCREQTHPAGSPDIQPPMNLPTQRHTSCDTLTLVSDLAQQTDVCREQTHPAGSP